MLYDFFGGLPVFEKTAIFLFANDTDCSWVCAASGWNGYDVVFSDQPFGTEGTLYELFQAIGGHILS